jgi:hypothetical protein
MKIYERRRSDPQKVLKNVGSVEWGWTAQIAMAQQILECIVFYLLYM